MSCGGYEDMEKTFGHLWRVEMVKFGCTGVLVQWQYLLTTQNPADLISRGTQVEKFAYGSLWWEGPEGLLQDPTRWPKLVISSPKDIQERRQKPAVLISRLAPVHSDKPSDVKHWRLNPVYFSS